MARSSLVLSAAVVIPRPAGQKGLTDEVHEYIGITKQHWVSRNSRTVCKSRSCRNKFTLVNGPNNCFKCGEVFCKLCLKQTRRLNIHASYDPQGKFYKVCRQCFDSDQQVLGATRGLMKEFRALRSVSHNGGKGLRRSEWETAEQRIVDGFLAEVNSTHSLVRMVQSLTVKLVKGVWKKPSMSVADKSICWSCTKQFERIFRPKHQCSICGAAVCESCSNKDLLVYVPNEFKCREGGGYPLAKLHLIRLQGAPESEPDIHEYLRICNGCHQIKENRQLQDVVDGQKDVAHGAFWDKLIVFHEELLRDQRNIEESLEKYAKLVRSLEDGSERNGFGSSVQVLSKAQIDLTDLLYNYLKLTSQVKFFKPITSSTVILLKNLQLSTSKFYGENKALFVELKGSLEKYLPIEVVETVQNQVNKKALLCVHLLVKQLAFEILSLTDKQLGAKAMDIVQKLVNAEQAIGDELKNVLYKLEGESMCWEDHMKDTNEMVKYSMQEHTLIRPSTTVMSHPDFLFNEVVERSCYVLDQISMQLSAKTTQNSFKKVKDIIQEMKDHILTFACA